MSMFDVLTIIINDLGINNSNYKEVYFTTKELTNLVGVGDDALSKNLQRLVKRDLLVRVEFRKRDCPGRFCKYRVGHPHVISFVQSYYGDKND